MPPQGTHVDPSHRNVAEYWSEYDGLEQLSGLFDPEWKFRHLHMPAHAWSPKMHRYPATMIQHAPGRPVLQFNEVDFRLAWLRDHCPGARN